MNIKDYTVVPVLTSKSGIQFFVQSEIYFILKILAL